ncbi:hypothetical protein C8A03DRAFT_31075 [Achaetomium macrosporum]|uniref:Uncharacterized protein n=1 Tax=Achaetomium macrosporum TaxID=79813 RepID=A0AAN7CEX0_9PEZI|nr:hypothetical protein C8A03DRAFT_31075 [Achaetomium macrosporum]
MASQSQDGIVKAIEALHEVLKRQEEEIALLKSQIWLTRQIPPIPPLRKPRDLNTYRDNLARVLERCDLAHYIKEDVPEPEDPGARRQWKMDRLDVDEYLQATVPDHVVWTKEGNPTKTFDCIVEFFEKKHCGPSGLLREFVNMSPRHFDSLFDFQTRIDFLKQRLQTSALKMADEAYTWITLTNIEEDDPKLFIPLYRSYHEERLDLG